MTNGTFRTATINDSPELLEKSYRLRYQVYCLERHFLSADEYPSQLESDEFDRGSVHLGAVDAAGELAGTARIVRPNGAGLPLFRYCTLFAHETTLDDVANKVVEISRVCISRRYSRRRADVPFGLTEAADSIAPVVPAHERRQGSADPFGTLVKAIYQATKRLGGTHWIVAIEESFRRRIARYGFPFWLAGPEVDYYGMVSPYIMSLAEFDQIILGGQFALLDDFLLGLEPEFWPTLDDHETPVFLGAG